MTATEFQHLAVLPGASSGGAGAYIDWGVVHISVANLFVIVLMLVTFVAALLIPFPGGEEEWVPAAQGPSEEPGVQR